MKISVFIFCLLLVNCIQVAVSRVKVFDLRDAPYLFDNFIKEFHRKYKDYAEYMKRYAIFVNNLQECNKSNIKYQNDGAGITQFSDMTYEEYNKMLFPIRLPEA
ncbi:hypothetical protein ABMA27_014782 [Loxostege sticticalis]|uniref:Cathepsin propeptide inhibitor domain-containing protein n=1 Tax=Loxostege sticticalis TaxID=481309 RepID=A0ABR3IA68_LOXSC